MGVGDGTQVLVTAQQVLTDSTIPAPVLIIINISDQWQWLWLESGAVERFCEEFVL